MADNSIACYRCCKKENLIPCSVCKLLFHAQCIEVTDMSKPDSWVCLICKLAQYPVITPSFIGGIYKALEDNPTSPLRAAVASLTSITRSLSFDIDSLKLEIHNLRKPPEILDSSMTEGKEKRVLLFGNDLSSVNKVVRQLLPKEVKLACTPYKSASMERMAEQALKTIEEGKDGIDYTVYIHPGAEECLLHNSTKLVAALRAFVTKIKEKFPQTVINVISVPQIIPDVCEMVNNEFMQLDEGNILNYICMTKVQADLCLKRARYYDDTTSGKVARILANHIADNFKVKVVPLKPAVDSKKKNQNDGKNGVKKDERKEETRKGKNGENEGRKNGKNTGGKALAKKTVNPFVPSYYPGWMFPGPFPNNPYTMPQPPPHPQNPFPQQWTNPAQKRAWSYHQSPPRRRTPY